MNFNHTYRLLKKTAITALAIMPMSCTETIEIDFPEEDQQLVVYSLFHPDSVWQVSVSATKDLNSPGAPYPVIDEATVEIYQGNQQIDVLEFQGYLDPTTVRDLSRGITYDTVFWRKETLYRSAQGAQPKPDVDYTVRVSAPGYASVEATSRIPINPTIMIEKVNLDKDIRQSEFDDRYLKVTSKIHDFADQNNFYLAGAFYKNFELHLREDSLYDSVFYKEYTLVETTDIQSIRLQTLDLFSDQSFFGISYPVEFSIRLDYLFTANDIDSLVLFTGLVSEPFYRYYESLKAQEEYGVGLVNLTDPPKAYSNVENGLGIFAGYNTINFTIYREDFE